MANIPPKDGRRTFVDRQRQRVSSSNPKSRQTHSPLQRLRTRLETLLGGSVTAETRIRARAALRTLPDNSQKDTHQIWRSPVLLLPLYRWLPVPWPRQAIRRGQRPIPDRIHHGHARRRMRTQQIITHIYCDQCSHEGDEDVEAETTFTLAIDEASWMRSKPRQLDVCEAHAQPIRNLAFILRNARPVIVEHPRTQAQSTQAELPIPKANPEWSSQQMMACPLCETEILRGSMPAHLKVLHNIPLPVQPKKCPDCGYKGAHSQSMQQHRYKKHGYLVLNEMLTTLDKGE